MKNTLKLKPNVIFLLAVEAIFAYLFIRSFRYSAVAALMPGIVIAAILLVTSILLVRELWIVRQGGSEDTAEKVKPEFSESIPAVAESDPKKERQRLLEISAWLAGFSVLIYLLGFYIAIPIFLFLFLRIRFSIRWITTILIIIGFSVGVYLIFVVWLETILYPGLIHKLFIPK